MDLLFIRLRNGVILDSSTFVIRKFVTGLTIVIKSSTVLKYSGTRAEKHAVKMFLLLLIVVIELLMSTFSTLININNYALTK